MKSNSAGPDFVLISRRSSASEAWVFATSSATIAGSVSSAGGAAPAGGPAGASSGSNGMKPRSTTVCSASPISGSSLRIMVRRAARIAGDARRCATSTNSLPPASYIRGSAISWCTESPSGFRGSVIICW